MAVANNISLPEPLLAEMRAAALTQHRSVEKVFEEAVKTYLSDRSFNKWLDSNRELTKALGIEESDVDRLIAESRAENRAR